MAQPQCSDADDTEYKARLDTARATMKPKEWHRFLRREKHSIDQRLHELGQEDARLKKFSESAHSLDRWLQQPRALERPTASWMHHLRDAIKSREVLFFADVRNRKYTGQEFNDAFADAQLFLVEHDWAAAFSGAGDFAEGDFRLPFDVCAFELHVSGSRTIALMTTCDEKVLIQIAVRHAGVWFMDDNIYRHENGRWISIMAGRDSEREAPLIEFIGAQVRAISIALDAQVAVREVVRAPEKASRLRMGDGKHPLPDHYIISLCRRTRAAPLPHQNESDEHHSRRRLHFRRGHWRHYESHKTWIRWMLVGDPDLGFVEKEYRI